MLVPVLGRPANAQPLVDSLAATDPDAHLWFLCSRGDDAEVDACQRTGMTVVVADFAPGPGDYARKINLGYRLAFEHPYVLCAADDLRFHAGWDEAALRMLAYDVGVVGTNDLGNSQVIAGLHSTHPLVARGYIDSLGGYVGGEGRVYFEGYDHQWCDVELVLTAQQRGCYAHAHGSRVEHLHPLWRKARTDATYRKGQAHGATDRRLFESRRRLWELEQVPA